MAKISEVVKGDLELLQNEYHRLWAVSPEDRNPNEFVWPLKRYMIVEDMLVTPALEDHLGREGVKRHRRLSDDDESINAKLKHMQLFEKTELSFDSALRAIWVDLEPHIKEEANSDLDRLEEKISPSDSEVLASKYEHIKSLLQQPYGEGGSPDQHILMAMLDMSPSDLMVKFGISR